MSLIKRFPFILLFVLSGFSAQATIDSVLVTNSVNTICYDSCNGEAFLRIYASTSIGPFRVVWKGNTLPGQNIVDTITSTDTIFDLCADNYSLEIEDLSDTTFFAIQYFSIVRHAQMSPVLQFTPPDCHDSLDGSITVLSVLNGTLPFRYQWSSGPNDTLSVVNNLGKGVYNLKVIDAFGCEFFDSVQLKGPDSLEVNIGAKNVTCSGDCDGAAFTMASGGNPPYSYLWNNSDTSESIDKLCPGNFLVTITDNKGCVGIDSVIVSEPDSVLATFAITDVACNGEYSGEIVASAAGGIRPYTYQWSGYSDNDSTLNNGKAGLITATITDTNGCYYTENVTINEPLPISIQPTINPSSCGVCDGDINVSVSGGSGPFKFLWIGQKVEDTINTIDSLCPGIYQLLVTDALLCSDTFDIILNDDTSGIKDITFIVSSTSCANICDGSVLATPLSGIGPYSYLWSPGLQTDSVITGMCTGNYTVEITDASGCKRIESIIIKSESNLIANYTTGFVGCQGEAGGEINLTVSDGKPPYTYSWPGNNSTGSNIASLLAGTYPFKITDDNGCEFNDTVIVSDPDTIGIDLILTDESCFGDCNGSASVTVSSGQGPFTYNWSNGAMGTFAGALCVGNYWVEVKDNNGCVKRKSFTIVGPAEIQSNALIVGTECNLSNGSIKLIPSGGTGPYTYCWFNQSINDSIGRLDVNVISPYTVKITDANGCTKADSFVISSINGPNLIVNVTDETCPGACDGIISLSAPGVTGPISYIWMPSSPTTSAISQQGGLCPGTYYVGIEAGSCKTIEAVVVKKAATIDVNFNITSAAYNGSCDASILANVSGGLPPYILSWSTGSLKVISGLCAGSYSLNVTDARGCTINKTVDVIDPPPIVVTLNTSNLTCYNVCDGQILSTITGGIGPYTYAWSNGGNGKNAENLCPGTYYVTVTDSKGGTGSDTISLGNGVPITTTFTSTDADCGLCNGSLSVNASAGNGQPYSYLWSNGETSNSISNLSAGIYTVTVSDYQGCSQDFITTVNNIGGPTLSDTSYGVSCNGSCDGSGKVFATGATAPYFFQWNDPLKQTGDSASALCGGTYYYSATDSLGCVSFDSVEILEPEKINFTVIVSEISCPGNNDGAISLTINGGKSPYSFLWSNGDTTSFTDSLSLGIYTVTITDSTGCTAFDTIELNDPIGLSVSFIVTNANCFGSCDGIIEAIVSGGIGPFSYLWNDPLNQTTNIAAGLCTGFTLLTITDSKGCSISDSALVVSPSGINVTPVLSNPSCFEGDDGSINLTIIGGTTPYQVSWDNGMNGSSITGLEDGTYNVTIIDSNQCIFQNSYILNDPLPLGINITVTKPACGLGNGSASAVASGGSGSYSFLWNSIPSQSTSTASALWAGIYEVVVTDNNTGCVNSKEVILDNAGAVSLSFIVSDESCKGNCDGVASVLTGIGNLTYLWNDLSLTTDSTASNLCVGTYTVRVEDTSSGCVSFDTISVKTNDYFARLVAINSIDCFGDCDGAATIEGVNGIQPIQYAWNTVPPQLTQTAIDLCSGIYFGTATDSAGCSESILVTIDEPDSIVVDLTILNNILCAGTCSGRAMAKVSGGNGPYSYSWNGVLGGDFAIDLCSGTNSLLVIDSKGCSKSLTFEIIDAVPITDNEIISLPGCGLFNGSITLNPGGGTGPYTYLWSTGAQTSLLQNVFAGIYSVTITDSKGCSEIFNYFLNNPNAPLLNFDKNTVKCNGDCNGVARVTPVGGVAPFSYIWDNVPFSISDSLTDLCSGVYFVKVTDATGCVAFGADTITEPPVLTATLSKITDGCGGFCEGEAMIVGLGGTMPYNYQWNSTPPQSTFTATSLCAGTAIVILSDANGCVYTDSVNIVPPPALVIDSLKVTNASCFTNSDGEVTVFFQGGTTPIRILWSDNQKTQTASGLNNGQMTVIVSDTNGCFVADTAIIGVEDTVLVTAFIDSFVCIGNTTLFRAEGVGASTFQWIADSSGTLISLGSGDSLYYVVDDSIIIYLRGQNDVTPPCFDSDTAFIVGIPPPIIVASASSNPIEEGETTELLASPFLFNGSYAWTPSGSLNDTASIAPIASPSETTTYIVIGKDEYGCFGSDTITIIVIEDESIINGFTPNGDGVNDVWVIPSLEDYPNVIVEVYNRWGIQVFRSEGYKNPWDGTFEGSLLPSSSYYYVIDFNGDGEKVETGAVTILF